MSPERGRREKERENNAKYYGHLHFCLQPRAGHALLSDQKCIDLKESNILKFGGKGDIK